MVCADVDIDEGFDPLWKCECGYRNLEEYDECQLCGRYRE